MRVGPAQLRAQAFERLRAGIDRKNQAVATHLLGQTNREIAGAATDIGHAGTRPQPEISNDALGPAYGENPLLIRSYRLGRDFLLAHTRKVFVEPGDRVTRGMLVARASDSGAPDGCHLHFEVRTAGGGLDTAVRPLPYLDLTT